MRFFFRSRSFKIILAVFAAVVLLSAISGLIGMKISPQANIAGSVAAPFQKAATAVKNALSDFVRTYTDGNQLMLDNAALKKEIDELREKLTDYDEAVAQNEFYENYLGIKEAHPDFTFAAATLIAKDREDPYAGFTVNCGTLNEVAVGDPVITDAGLVGVISAAGLTTAKVRTVLDPNLVCGGLDSRTGDSGVICGTLELAQNGLCKFYNLSRSCNVAIGDYVTTSGEGVFPRGLLVGSIEAIGTEQYNTSIYADVKPFVDFETLRNVMIITAFDGQNSAATEAENE